MAPVFFGFIVSSTQKSHAFDTLCRKPLSTRTVIGGSTGGGGWSLPVILPFVISWLNTLLFFGTLETSKISNHMDRIMRWVKIQLKYICPSTV